ncbi:MAG: aminoacyl-tRNA hydrolase [Gemmatimonadota bacterium]|nr:aminoacyl-tRNA hydrolase [Gemmatimonadota bacterium]MDH3422550.1 aminoacyl-tRNA hydrolase [Gemmatimonadota bacterium]
MKAIVGLGNPGPQYDATRHNVGWWVADRLAYDWGFDSFRRDGPALVTEGTVDGTVVRLLKPTTYMNRSGLALRPLIPMEDFDASEDLLIVVDDASLDVGRVRFRPEGGPGGHNGLKSVAGALQSNEYARLRIGVGKKPDGADLSDWVLAPMPVEDEDVVVELLPDLTKAVEAWVAEGVEPAMNRFNR